MKILFTSILLFVAITVFCQENYTSRSELDKSTNKTLEKAEKAFKKKDYKKARKEYLKALKKYPNLIHGLIRMGTIELEGKEQEKAIAYFSSAAKLSNSYEPKVLSTLAALYESKDDYSSAQKYYSLYKKELSDEKKITQLEEKIRLNQVRDSLVKNEVDFERVRLDSTINTEAAEYLPALNADGTVLIFARIVRGQEDFYLSALSESGYNEAIPLQDLNTPQNEAAHSLSADGQVIIFTACDRMNGKGSCDLYFSTKQGDGWSVAKNLGNSINSEAWDSQPSISADGKTLYFSSKRKGGPGAADIYYSTLENRRWSVPIPLPDNVNTEGNEMSPFIHADGRTLYFKSDKHPGMGSYDIFVSRKRGDKWSDPENLGYPINTKGDDGALSISTDGLTAYYSSDEPTRNFWGLKRKGKRNYDIYKFTLPDHAKPIPSTYIRFKVVDAIKKTAIESELTITSLSNGETLYQKSGNAKDGFLTVLTRGENYSVYVEKEGYLFHSENLNMEEEAAYFAPLERTIELVPIPEPAQEIDPIIYDTPIVLRNIFFKTASAELLAESQPEIERLQTLLNENTEIKIRIVGHTDNVGNSEYNKGLSQQRADAVKNKLIELGVSHTRLSTIGMGEEQPIANNEEESGRQQNRRTEFVIIK